MALHRTFISFELPPDIRESVREFRLRIQPCFRNVRWEPPEKYHATIKFLGMTDDRMIPDILARLGAAARTAGTIPVTVAGFGAFPSLRRPRVLWIGCGSSDRRLDALHRDIESGMEALGFPKD